MCRPGGRGHTTWRPVLPFTHALPARPLSCCADVPPEKLWAYHMDLLGPGGKAVSSTALPCGRKVWVRRCGFNRWVLRLACRPQAGSSMRCWALSLVHCAARPHCPSSSKEQI